MTIAVISMIRDPWGGSEELWYQMAKEALAQGHKVIHLAYEHPLQHPKTIELERLGLVRILRPGWIPPGVSTQKKFLYLGRNFLRKKIASPIRKLFKLSPDVILYNGTCYSIAQETELLELISAQKTRIRFFILGQLNSDFNRGLNEVEASRVRKAYHLCRQVFFVSARNLETAKRHLCMDIPNGQVVRNPVNLNSVALIPLPDTEKEIAFACVGNLVTVHKGQDIMLQALKKWENRNWKLNIYGTGMDEGYLKNLVHYLGLDQKVVFHGIASDIREVWKQNQVLLMPSHMEGMPLAVVEAMLCGRVCITTDVGGNREWISDGRNGFIADAATESSLLSGLQRAWALKDDWQQIGLAAHNRAIELYDPGAGATLLNRIIAE